MEILSTIFSAFGLSASAGLNAYIPLLVTALLAKYTDLINLTKPWDALTSWWIIGLLIVLTAIEFLVDKVPVVNHINDAVQTFIRPTAGALVFAASTNVVTEIHPVLALGLGLLVAGSVHVAKSVAVRPAATVISGGTADIPISMAEDATATTLSVLSIVVPLAVATIILLLLIWVVWHFWLRPILD